MANLGIAHLAVGKADRQAARVALLEGALRHETVHDGSLCHIHRVLVVVVRKPVSVEHHQHYRSLFHRIHLIEKS